MSDEPRGPQDFDPSLYFDASDKQFHDNIDYHFKDVLSGFSTPSEEVKHLIEGWREWNEDFDEAKQSLVEMLDAYDSFVTRVQNHAVQVGARLHEAIYRAKKEATR